jgi:HEAT repeat protein
MIEPRTHRNVDRDPKKSVIPLSKLRTAEVVKTVLDHPRRIAELVSMLEDRDRSVRGRAAATLARLSESHPGRVVRLLERIKASLGDESAYVRWHMAYALGRLSSNLPHRSPELIPDLITRLDDENRMVRLFSCGALGRIAACKPQAVEEVFQNHKREIPPTISQIIRDARNSLKNS